MGDTNTHRQTHILNYWFKGKTCGCNTWMLPRVWITSLATYRLENLIKFTLHTWYHTEFVKLHKIVGVIYQNFKINLFLFELLILRGQWKYFVWSKRTVSKGRVKKKITRRTTTSERNKFLQVVASFRKKESDSKSQIASYK